MLGEKRLYALAGGLIAVSVVLAVVAPSYVLVPSLAAIGAVAGSYTAYAAGWLRRRR